VKFVYIAIIVLCTAYNSAAQTVAFAAIGLSLKYNIPLSVMIQAGNDPDDAIMMLSLKQLGEVDLS
jgi:hypothetical protein